MGVWCATKVTSWTNKHINVTFHIVNYSKLWKPKEAIICKTVKLGAGKTLVAHWVSFTTAFIKGKINIDWNNLKHQITGKRKKNYDLFGFLYKSQNIKTLLWHMQKTTSSKNNFWKGGWLLQHDNDPTHTTVDYLKRCSLKVFPRLNIIKNLFLCRAVHAIWPKNNLKRGAFCKEE